MKLDEYFEHYCINVRAFARKIGKSTTFLYRVMHGKCIPKASDAKAIEVATEGKVTREELLFPEEHTGGKDSGSKRPPQHNSKHAGA